MPEKLDELIPTRRTLLSRLKQWDDQESWQDFFNTYWKLIYHVALRAGLPEHEAQDVVQDTIVTVARQIPNFKYDPGLGSFKSWLYLITQRRITDHLRKKYRQPRMAAEFQRETSQTAALERVPGPGLDELENIWEQEWRQHVIETAMRRVKAQVDPKQYQLFDCYVRKEWPVKDICSAFGVSANQVYLAKHRVTELLEANLKEEARNIGKKMGAIT